MANELVLEGGVWKFRTATSTTTGNEDELSDTLQVGSPYNTLNNERNRDLAPRISATSGDSVDVHGNNSLEDAPIAFIAPTVYPTLNTHTASATTVHHATENSDSILGSKSLSSRRGLLFRSATTGSLAAPITVSEPFTLSIWAKSPGGRDPLRDENVIYVFDGATWSNPSSTNNEQSYFTLLFGPDYIRIRLVFYSISAGWLARRRYMSHPSTAWNGSWHHHAFTYDGSNSYTGMVYYYDGVAQSMSNAFSGNSTTWANNFSVQNYKFYVGNAHSETDSGILLDEAAFWDTELSSTDIASLYNSGAGAAANTVQLSNLKEYVNFENFDASSPTVHLSASAAGGFKAYPSEVSATVGLDLNLTSTS